MRTTSLIAAAGILAIAATSFAAPAKTQKVWASGQIKSVDGTKTVVLKQGTHEMSFTLAANAQFMDGKAPLQAKDLAQDVGRPVRVRYDTIAGTKTADLVEVSAAKPAPAVKPARAAKPVAKK